ncbi:FecR family protein [Sunxiuqinia indica]|uniref:FecR family protein n=1 Tax=Sunxiuqinia indica TaxID=2692584 RepID=UPI001357F529|nr:FecR domain-containing protein [Sunxiuqinia indica]
MTEMQNNIDFIIIWKKINDKLSVRQEKEFNQWLKADYSHQVFFEKVLHYYKTGEVKNARDHDFINAWKSIEPHLKDQKIRRMPDWIKISASVAATVLIMLSVYLFVDTTTESENVTTAREMIIPPGSSKARLIFDDGESVDLAEGRDFHGEVDGAQILNKGNQISYVGTKATEVAEVKYNTLEIPRGAEYFVILSDSTKVWLNSDSRLRYPTAFVGDVRQVELEGEAYFEVTKNTAMPFQVVSQGQVVEVLGTEFNLSSYNNDDLIYTTLVEGQVKVYTEDNPELTQTLVPGYQTYMYKESGDISVRKVDVNEYVAWKEGVFYFKNENLENMMHTISRWYDIDVIFEQERKRSLKFTGEIKRYENLERMLQLLEETQEVNFTKEGKEIRIN